MFSFFGAFTDVSPALAESFHQHWPDADVVDVTKPFRGLAVRFNESTYAAGSEDLPEEVSTTVREISRQNPNARIVLLRTECFGGICENWGQFILNGRVVLNEPFVEHPGCKGALRRLLSNLDVDLDAEEIFEPLSRGFPWESVTCLFIQPHTQRPDFRLVISFLWGDSANVDTEGDSYNPASRDWTELYCMNRENEREVFDIGPVVDEPLTLEICSEVPELAARVTCFLASSTDSRVAPSQTGPWHEVDWLTGKMGDFDLSQALDRVARSRWRSATLDNPYPDAG